MLVSLIMAFSLHAAAKFRPVVNIDELAKISWRKGEAKLAMRNDWLGNYLNIALNESITNSPDIKSGHGDAFIVSQSTEDSIVTLGFSFNVVPKGVWFDPHVLCDGRIRLSFPQTALARAQIQILDREPIQNCEVNGSVGHALDLGRLVRDKLNETISNKLADNFLYKIGSALFGNEDLQDRMTRMYLVQALVPFATIGMDDCEADPGVNITAGSFICLKIKWPSEKFDAAVAKIIAALPSAQPVLGKISQGEIDQWRALSPTCEKNGILYPSKGNCETGDMNLFAGLLCLSGEKSGCEMVRDSQDETGRWWRSPHHIGQNGDDFSADMFLGTVAYLNQTHDVPRFTKWLSFIESLQHFYPPQNGPRLRLFQSCPTGANGVCNLMGSEWNWLEKMSAWAPPLANPLPNYGYDPSWLVVEALSNERGFRLHLVGVSVLMQKMHGDKANPNVELAAKILAAREPQNPFFVFLALGHDKRVLDLLNQQCPKAKPSEQNQWSWERKIDEKAYRNSMGWDCVFMGNLWNMQAFVP